MDKLSRFFKEQWEYGALVAGILLALLIAWIGVAKLQDMPPEVASTQKKLSRPKMLTEHACDFLDETQREQRDMQNCPFDIPSQLGETQKKQTSRPAPRPAPQRRQNPKPKAAQKKVQKPAVKPAQKTVQKPAAKPAAPATVALKLNFYMSTMKDNRSRVAFVELETQAGKAPEMLQLAIGQQIRGVTILDIQDNSLSIKDAKGKKITVSRKSPRPIQFLK